MSQFSSPEECLKILGEHCLELILSKDCNEAHPQYDIYHKEGHPEYKQCKHCSYAMKWVEIK